jgi:hypothetical protein
VSIHKNIVLVSMSYEETIIHMGEGKSRVCSDQPIQINYKKGDGIMKFAVLVNEDFYLLTEDGANYATFDTAEEAEEIALDHSDLDAEVITLV